ncbi:MAG: hypothetical protein K2G51_03920 [Lachnospiraceae bacterium]|nr:hypothetical protein [Lachnospiraceae bacterium]MDE7271598.1 hypothetical protein [Lachnospiraceae bacterium]
MYPMIISAEEVTQIDAIVKEVEQELKEAQIPHRIKPLNIRKLRRRAVFAMKDQSISEGVMQL